MDFDFEYLPPIFDGGFPESVEPLNIGPPSQKTLDFTGDIYHNGDRDYKHIDISTGKKKSHIF